MSNDIAISVRGLGKSYRRSKASSQHNSLRELLSNTMTSAVRGRGSQENRDTFWALAEASFDVRRGENVGIIGLNGAGKSTLLKLLSRITTPTTGHARIVGRMGALLEVGTGFHSELTGRENAYLYGAILGMSRDEVRRKFDDIVQFAEITEFIDTPVKRYSSGMYVRLAFSVAAHLEPDILLLDEVLAVGDYTFQRKCMDFARRLESRGSTILFVSHNMSQIKTMCARVIYLKKGGIVFDGATEEGLRRYEADSRLEPAPWFRPDAHTARVSITEVSLQDEHGNERSVFELGERMKLVVHYDAPVPVEKPDVRIGINRQDDLHCCSFSTISDGIALPRLEGKGVIEMITPPIRLVSDRYMTTISVREKEYGNIACAIRGPSFHMKHPIYTPYAFGVYHEHGEWQLNKAAGAA